VTVVYNNRTWNFRPNGSADAAARLAANFSVFDEGFLREAPTVFGTPLRDISLSRTYDLYRQNPGWFVLDEPLAYQNDVQNSTEFTEIISAAYLRADVRLLANRLWIAGGVRFERTDAEGRGPIDDINAMYRWDANGQRVLITTDPLAQRKLRYQERAAHAERDYSDFYPSVNASYEITNDLILRAAYARTIGRPNISSIVPGTTISDDEVATPTLQVNNTGLVPWTADNFDLSLESYNFKGGFGSIGVFSKSIDNFFGEVSTPATPQLLESYGLATDGSLQNYTLVTEQNAGSARIRGIEFGYRQSLTFLPHWARDLQVFVNLTRLRLSGEATADFSGFNPSSVAGGINFVRPRYFIKLTYSYQGETRRGSAGASAANGIPPETFNYQGKRTRLGLSVQYSFHRRLAVYGLITDLGGFELLNRQYAASTPEYARGNRIQDLGYYVTLGMKGTF
jgi:TonB-dependent receptor